MNLVARRWLSVAVTVAVGAAIVAADVVTWASLRDPRYLTGWILFAVMIALALYGVRKKLPFLPLGTVAGWRAFHVLAGWLGIALFLLHVGFRLPQGALEISLAAMYLVVAVSGVAGLMISRIFAKRLTTHGDEVIHERIPVFLKLLRDECDDRIEQSVAESGSTTVADFYTSRVRPFIDRPRNLAEHVFGWNRARYTMRGDFDLVRRYLNADEEKALDWLFERVREKNQLDYAYALQGTLKGWLFFHVPLTCTMLLLSVVHVILVHAFSGGLS